MQPRLVIQQHRCARICTQVRSYRGRGVPRLIPCSWDPSTKDNRRKREGDAKYDLFVLVRVGRFRFLS